VKLDFSDIPNGARLGVDVLANIRGTWKRLPKVEGSVLEFCRDDPAEDIERFILVLSNSSFQGNGTLAGNYRLTSKRACPARWSGTIHYTCTDDESSAYSGPGIREQVERHRVEQHVWTIAGQGRGPLPVPGLPPGTELPEVDYLDLVWQGSRTIHDSNLTQYDGCIGGPVVNTRGGSGSGTGKQKWVLVADGPMPILSPFPDVANPNGFDVTTSQSVQLCSGESATFPGQETVYEYLPALLTEELTNLKPLPSSPDRFAGEKTLLYDVTPVQQVGQRVIECKVRWQIARDREGL
jgi:hypothetical protein